MDTLPGVAQGKVRNYDYIKVIVPSMALRKGLLKVFVYLVVHFRNVYFFLLINNV